jgi:hypothetical protein
MWENHKELDSGNLASTIMAYLGNINELLLQGLTEERNALLGIANSIFTMAHLSAMMLRGVSPLMDKLCNLTEETDIPPLKWRYRCGRLRFYAQTGLSLTTDPEVWIKEGVDYFSARHSPIGEGIEIFFCPCFGLKISSSHPVLQFSIMALYLSEGL